MTDSAARDPWTPATPPRRLALEAAVVFGATVGISVVSTMLSGDPPAEAVFTDEHFAGLLTWEVLLAALLVPWLHLRGWRPGDAVGARTTDVRVDCGPSWSPT